MAIVNNEVTAQETQSRTDDDGSGAARIRDINERPKAHLSAKLTPTVFHQEWWLAAATNNSFGIAEVSSGGRVVGRLPYYLTKRYFFAELRMPPLTYFLGPGIDEGEGSENNRFLKRLDITRELLRQLPQAWFSYIKCHGGITDAIGFQQQCFRTHVQFTHVIPPAPVEQIWKRMRNKTRNVIRRAQEELSVEELPDVAQFTWLFNRHLASKGVRNDLEDATCTRIAAAALEHGQGRILVARGKTGNIQAATFCVWDASTSFYIMTTRDEVSGNGATSLLLWEEIKHAATHGLTFDFAGLGTSGSVLFYSGFGAIVQPRYVAVRTNRQARLLTALKGLISPENFYY